MKSTDFLIIGSGIAGLSFALKASKLGKVLIVTKNVASETNTRMAQGGIACVLNSDDNLELHVKDTLEAGAGLCNENAVRVMVGEARNCINELIELGVAFSNTDHKLDLGLEGGHTRNRIAHVKDFTGREIETVLLNAVRKHPDITILENHMAVDLIVIDEDHCKRCLGAEILDENTGEIQSLLAYKTILCTGGAGQVYLHTTNPSIATGDGVAMAFRAGAIIKDMEFVQFHPTALYFPGKPVFLISEALRGAGAILKNKWGNPFMDKHHPLGSLAPRDITSRAIENEMRETGTDHVFLDATHIPTDALINLFPNIYDNCFKLGIDITTSLIPVAPSAHFMCGGIATDINGSTGIESLYAFGEVACTGVHGANRLASNSLLEAMVFSNRAFLDINFHWNKNVEINQFRSADNRHLYIKPDLNKINRILTDIRQLMSRYAGIIRHPDEMEFAVEILKSLETDAKDIFLESKNSRESIELYNLAIVARLIISAAIERKSSIGAHYITKNAVSTLTKVNASQLAAYVTN